MLYAVFVAKALHPTLKSTQNNKSVGMSVMFTRLNPGKSRTSIAHVFLVTSRGTCKTK